MELDVLLSYILYACGSVFALAKYFHENPSNFNQLPYATFIIMAVHSCAIGIRYANDSIDDLLLKIIRLSSMLASTVALSCYVSEIWIKYGVCNDYNIGHALAGLSVGLISFLSSTSEYHMIHLLVNAEAISLAIVGFMNSNYLAAGAGITFALGYFLTHDGNIRFGLLPDFQANYVYALFSPLAYFGLTNTSPKL